MGTPKQVQTNQATYGWEEVPETADMKNFRGTVNQGADLVAPVAQQRAETMEALYDPTYMPTDMTAGDYAKVMQGKRFRANMDYGSAIQDALRAEHALKTEGLGSIAQMMAPRMVQKSGRQESFQQGGGWGVGGSLLVVV